MLETLAHYEASDVPPTFQLLEIEVPDGVATDHWPSSEVGEWDETVAWGSDWLASGQTALAYVPSVIVPGDKNWLLNPAHTDARRIEIVAAAHHPWDRRLFR